MDLRSSSPRLNLYNREWPIYNYQYNLPPAKFIHNEEIDKDGLPRIGKAINSVVCDGCIISGGNVTDSVLSNSVHIHSYSTVQNSILLNDVAIGEHSRIKNAIIDKHVELPPRTVIGYNRTDDERHYTVVDLDEDRGTWLTIIPKNHDTKEKKLPKDLNTMEI
jgi:glucose-1-phosphate adenylyltransferase